MLEQKETRKKEQEDKISLFCLFLVTLAGGMRKYENFEHYIILRYTFVSRCGM